MSHTERPYDQIRDVDPRTLTKAERASAVVRKLGVTHTQAREALAEAGWDVQRAIDVLVRRTRCSRGRP